MMIGMALFCGAGMLFMQLMRDGRLGFMCGQRRPHAPALTFLDRPVAGGANPPDDHQRTDVLVGAALSRPDARVGPSEREATR